MDLPDIRTQGSDSILLLKVSPKAKQNAITGVHDGQLKVSVTAVPEKGKANTAVLKLLARELKIARSQIQIVRGENSSQKQLQFVGVTPEELAGKLRKHLNSTS